MPCTVNTFWHHRILNTMYDDGHRCVREALSRQYDLGSCEPNIHVWIVNVRGDRALILRHTQHNSRPLDDSAKEVLRHVARLRGFPVHLESVDADGNVTQRWAAEPKD